MVTSKNLTAQDFEDLGVYLRGLLLIMAVDNHLHEKQQDRIKKFARDMGFEDRYIERNIATVLENKYIPRVPPKFHSKNTAKSFLLEAAEIAVCDGLLHPLEKQWLVDASKINELDTNLITEILDSVPLSDQIPS